MSGLVGHTLYAVLGAKAAADQRLPVAPIIQQHWSSYLAGAYLGCDIQTMPEAVRVATGEELGYGTAPLDPSDAQAGPTRPFTLSNAGQTYTPRDIHQRFYGRAHLTFGWSKAEQSLTVPIDHLPDYCSAVAADAQELFGPGHRPLAYALGWMTHLVGDGLIKSIWPGVTLNLLDGKYTPRNRPVQDLVGFHEIGRKELQLDWPALWTDLAATPVEPIQRHYMRVDQPRGRLGRDYAEGWLPGDRDLLTAILAENRRYLAVLVRRELAELALTRTETGWECNLRLREATGGLSYAQMVETAEKANLRRALWQIGQAIAGLFRHVSFFAGSLNDMPRDTGPSWSELGQRWGTAE